MHLCRLHCSSIVNILPTATNMSDDNEASENAVAPREHEEFSRLPIVDPTQIHDPVLRFRYKQHDIREKIVENTHIRMLHEELNRCYHTNGVNHLTKCKHITRKLLELLAKQRPNLYKDLPILTQSKD